MQVIAALGHLPAPVEFPDSPTFAERFGSLKRAFAAIQRITGAETWEAIAKRRRKDLLVYLALSRFRKRPALSRLPLTLQRDIKAFFGTYATACADRCPTAVPSWGPSGHQRCRQSAMGKLLPDDLEVHREMLDRLQPLLRIYEECGRAYLGGSRGQTSSRFTAGRANSRTSYIRTLRMTRTEGCCVV
jgi:DNA phosphorothioation-associated putative methyltransferase